MAIENADKEKLNALEIKAGRQVTASVNGVLMRLNLADFPHTHLLGEKKNEEFDIEFYAVPDGVQTVVYDAATNSAKMAPVAGWSVHRGKEVELVRLDNGSTIITDNDPRAVYGIAADADTLVPERFTPSEALRRRVCVPVVVNYGVPRKELGADGVELVDYAFAGDFSNTYYNQTCEGRFQAWFDFRDKEVLDDPDARAWDSEYGFERFVVPMDFEFGQFLGCICGDGWWDKQDYDYFYRHKFGQCPVYISDNIGCNAEFCISYLRKLLGQDVEVHAQALRKEDYADRYGDTVKYAVHHENMEVVTGALEELIGGARDTGTAGSGNKKLPPWHAVAPRECRVGMLCGLLSTDGSISVNRHEGTAGRKPQLQASLSSTSLNLLNDVRSLLLSLNITSSITFSKETDAGNYHWMLSISTVGLKAIAAEMSGMCAQHKYEILCSTEVSSEATAKRGMHIVFPKCVSDVVKKWMYMPKITSEMRRDATGTYKELIAQNDFGIQVHAWAKNGYVTPAGAEKLYSYARRIAQTEAKSREEMLHVVQDLQTAVADSKATYPEAMDAALRRLMDELYPMVARKKDQVLNSTFLKLKRKMDKARKEGMIGEDLVAALKGFASCAEPGRRLIDEPVFGRWLNLAYGGFVWAQVVGVEKTGKEETGYDLTVPGYETFMNAEGVILSNTINVHVPASDAAVKDAREKMMPSVTPFANREEGKIVPLPKQEQILGLYAANMRKPLATHSFASEQEALEAIRKGQVPLRDEVVIAPPGSQVKTAGSVQDPPAENVKGQSPDEGDAEEGGPVRDPRTGKWLPTERLKGVHRKKGETGHGGAGQLE